MQGLRLITLTGLFSSCVLLRLISCQRAIPLRTPHDEKTSQSHFLQHLARTRRHAVGELVRAQPHLVHDMSRPEIHETSRTQTETESANASHSDAVMEENMDVEDEMERMVHLAIPQHSEGFGGPGAGDASQEASGFYGTDAEDRGEDGGDDQERREDDWDRDMAEDRERRDGITFNHTTPDLDALIGYSSSFNPSGSSQTEGRDSGPMEHRGPSVLEMTPSDREAEKEEEVQSSGFGVALTSSVTATPTSAVTVTQETDTGTDFGLLEEKKEKDGEVGVFTQNPTAPEVGVAPSSRPLQPSVEEEQEHELEAGFNLEDESREEEEEEEERQRTKGREEANKRRVVPLTTNPPPTEPNLNLEEPQQVVCLNWSELAGRGYVVLNMTQNMNCEDFRAHQGVRLLRIIEREFARRMNSPEGTWLIYLSKPTHQQHQLLMNLASVHGVIATQDVMDMLGEIRRSLNKVGIQNYSAASTCRSRPSKTRSDYGKLFVVLVIIGSVCMVIISSGVIYICWQRRLPATKTSYRAEELHSVENGYHDNPTLDVTNDSQAEMREKKPSSNGLTGVGEGGGEETNRWQVFVNQAVTEEDEEEQDTHL